MNILTTQNYYNAALSVRPETAAYCKRARAGVHQFGRSEAIKLDAIHQFLLDNSKFANTCVIIMELGYNSESGTTLASIGGLGSAPTWTMVGGPTLAAGGRLLNGSTQHIEAADFLSGGGTFSMGANYNLIALGEDYAFAHYSTADNQRSWGLFHGEATNTLRMLLSNNGTAAWGQELQTPRSTGNKRLAFLMDGSTQRRVDGATASSSPTASGTPATSLHNSTRKVTIGCRADQTGVTAHTNMRARSNWVSTSFYTDALAIELQNLLNDL
jgi:hypothetical protein